MPRGAIRICGERSNYYAAAYASFHTSCMQNDNTNSACWQNSECRRVP